MRHVGQLQSLVTRYVYDTRITEASVAHFTQLSNSKILSPRANDVTDEGFAAINKIKNLTVLDADELKLRKQQFRHRCKQDLRRHALKERRLKAKLEREQARQQARHEQDAHHASQQQAQQQLRTRRAQQRRHRERQRQQAAHNRAQESPLAALLWVKFKPLGQTASSSQHQEQTPVCN